MDRRSVGRDSSRSSPTAGWRRGHCGLAPGDRERLGLLVQKAREKKKGFVPVETASVSQGIRIIYNKCMFTSSYSETEHMVGKALNSS